MYLSVCVYVNEVPSHYAIGDNPVLLMNMDELMDEVDRIIEMGDPVGDFLTSDEFTSVDPGLVDTDLVNPDEVNMNEHTMYTPVLFIGYFHIINLIESDNQYHIKTIRLGSTLMTAYVL